MAEKKEKKVAAKAPTKAKKVTAKVAEEKVVKAPKASKAKETVETPVVEASTKAEKTTGAKTPEWIAGASKQDLINEFATKGGDTGSPEVQVALATHKILNLTMHLEQNPKDNHSRRGLLKVISKRRRILNYLNEKDSARYKDLIKKVNLSK